MKKLFLVFMFFVPALLFAALGENGISVAPDGTELKWENGNWDFFIMHKSLVERQTGDHDSGQANPQADTCIDQNVGSTYTLTTKHMPEDAEIDRAFLIWLSTQDPENFEGKTDNSVTLTFTNAADPSLTLTKEITAKTEGTLAETKTGDFEYEALKAFDQTSGDRGIFTYRVDVSAFMKEIIEKGKAKGMNSGTALYGDYNVKGMECSNHQNYLNVSGLVGGWALPFVYTSSHISAKKIYFYHGLASYRFQAEEITVSGFELPDEAIIKLGFVAFEGDPGLANKQGTNIMDTAEPEALAVRGEHDSYYFLLSNECNPSKDKDSTGLEFEYTEVFNSISSIYSWNDKKESCIGNPDNPLDETNPIEYAIDNDTFVVDTTKEPFNTSFAKGDTEFNIKIGANQDQIYTNFMIVSVDTYNPDSWTDTDSADTDTSTDTDSADTDSADADTADTADPADSDTDASNSGSDASDSSTETGNMGESGGECYPNGTCNEGLTCSKDNICAKPLVLKKSSGCSILTVD